MSSRSLDELDAVQARRRLTVRDDDPARLGRRRFLQLMGMGVGAGAALGALDGLLPGGVLGELAPGGEAWAAPIGAADGIVVLVGMFGGSDGLNTVVPYDNADYLAQHGALALAANQLLPLGPGVGLHPGLPYLKSLYDRGDVAVVQGVGYPDPDLSHFSSMATWMHGRAGGGPPTSGWVGRWLDGLATRDLLRAATVGGGLPLHLLGEQTRGIAVPPWGMGFGGELSDEAQRGYAAVRRFSAASAGRGAWHDSVATVMRDVVDVGQQVAPVFRRDLPDNDLIRKMTVAARLVNADLGLRVIDTGFDGFDTHSGQPARLAQLLAEFDDSLKAFFTTLDDRFRSRVTVMTYSEFGRTSWSNDSAGTDHGTANNHFVIGAGVRGGLYGAQPSLAGVQRWDRMGFHVDFRSLYATVLDRWMGGGSSTVLGGTFADLGCFDASPGVGVAAGSVPATVLGDWVGLNPARVYDSRSSGRMLPLGAGTTGEVQVVGAGGVPAAGVTAVALNVTAVGATGASSFSVWPAGGSVPDVANVSVPTGFAMGSLVIAKPGAGGRVCITNDVGSAHCVVDVVGYFRTTAANRLQSLTPFRAMDTRNGTGGRTGALGPGGSFELAVRGVGGVPANADSVVVNVTAVQPTAGGYLTLWPAGQTRPSTSSLNFPAGATVPNLVISKIGTNGKVGIFNANGNTHVVVDVVGYLSSTASGRHFVVSPYRLLDTRPDDVAPLGPAGSVTLQALGVGGVPTSGVSAVALTIAAKSPTANTFVTAWPGGVARPNAASLNPRAGVDVSNLAIVRVGSDGTVNLYNQNGTLDLVVDVVGWFSG